GGPWGGERGGAGPWEACHSPRLWWLTSITCFDEAAGGWCGGRTQSRSRTDREPRAWRARRAAGVDRGRARRGADPCRAGPAPSPSASEVRTWARARGLRVGERGRLAPHVIEAWNEAHPDRPYR